MGMYYAWKVLSGDGLLLEPEEEGPYYRSESYNNKLFRTEEEALERLEEMKEMWEPHQIYHLDMTLVKVYSNNI